MIFTVGARLENLPIDIQSRFGGFHVDVFIVRVVPKLEVDLVQFVADEPAHFLGELAVDSFGAVVVVNLAGLQVFEPDRVRFAVVVVLLDRLQMSSSLQI